ncbi:uncharacterized protein LOC115651392 [Gopherus evgoodei]|uniref:uncharacterized protein LOC115651392 n=1 Tax=Gopherus evgoodei TaxID=1825980 RepID=UPI0011CF982A|nr:uncharacterized protein LOC115651392 [Gopherus evgoodei]
MEQAESELLATLKELGERELQRFKDKLSEILPKKGYQLLPSGRLKDADPPALTDLLLLFYGTDYGAEVTAEVLRAIDQGVLAKRIKKLIKALRDEKHYFKRQLQQHDYARGGVMYAKYTLNNEQYQTIRAEKTNQEKMRKLYQLVPSWDEWQKDHLYQALKETNRELVEELEEEHFVDRHREKLIQQVSEVDRVLKLLRGHTLTPEQYQSISTGRPNVEKMQKLYELVPSWRKERKDRLYRVLWITNSALVDECAGSEEHFVERNREQLIQCASSVDTTLDMLKQGYNTLFTKQPDSLVHSPYERSTEELEGSEEHSVERNREQLIQRTSSLGIALDMLKWGYNTWFTKQPDSLVHSPYENPTEELGGPEEHSVERNREQLIQSTSSLGIALDMLKWGYNTWFTKQPDSLVHSPYENPTEELGEPSKSPTGGLLQNRAYILNDEQYQTIRAEKTSQEKMRKLYKLVPRWDEWQKDRLYQALQRTNRDLTEELEEKHFVDRHREKLIQQVSEVDRVLKLLRGHTLTPEQYQSISTGRSNVEKMQKLYELVPSWRREQKDRLYRVLWITNRALADECAGEHFVDWSREKLIQQVSCVDDILDVLHSVKLQPEIQMQGAGTPAQEPSTSTSLGATPAGETSPSEDPSRDPWGQDKCDLCPREEDPPEEIQPETVRDPDGKQKTYRVHFPRAGSFRCSETELGLEVRAAVTVHYGYDSWDQHLSASEKQQWMVAGPLFNIRVVEPAEAGAVAAVHLPHFLCLSGAEADVSQLQVAHFVDCGMTLESPTRRRPFHAVLENPSFSPIGLLWKQICSTLFPPVHSLVLLYRSRRAADITLHFYLLPRDLSLAQAIDENEKNYQSIRVRKPSKTKPLHFGSCYTVSGSSDIEVTPDELEYCNMRDHPLDPDMEIYTEDLGNKLNLYLMEQNDVELVWKATVRPGDVTLPGSTPARAADIQDKMPETLRDALQETLDELGSTDIQRFKSKLNHMKLPEGYKRIPNGMLEEADSLTVCELLLQYYTMDGAVEVAIQALKGINQNELAGKLETDTSGVEIVRLKMSTRLTELNSSQPGQRSLSIHPRKR